MYMWLKNLKLIGQDDIIVSITGNNTVVGMFRKLCRLGLGKDKLISDMCHKSTFIVQVCCHKDLTNRGILKRKKNG